MHFSKAINKEKLQFYGFIQMYILGGNYILYTNIYFVTCPVYVVGGQLRLVVLCGGDRGDQVGVIKQVMFAFVLCTI